MRSHQSDCSNSSGKDIRLLICTLVFLLATTGTTLMIAVAVFVFQQQATETVTTPALRGRDASLPNVAITSRWVINMTALPNCNHEERDRVPRQTHPEAPCRRYSTARLPQGSESVGPLRCLDAENRPPDDGGSSSIFNLVRNSSRVAVTRAGTYLIMGQVTFRNAEGAMPVGLAVNDNLAFVCTAQPGQLRSSSGQGQQHPAYTSCSTQGLYRLRVGDEVWLRVPRFTAIEVQGMPYATALQIALWNG